MSVDSPGAHGLEALRREFGEKLQGQKFEPGTVIEVPDSLLLADVAEALRDKALAQYPQDVKDAPRKPLPLRERYVQGRPEGFHGRTSNMTVTIKEIEPEIIDRIPDVGSVDLDSMIAFTVGADALSSGDRRKVKGISGTYTRDFYIYVRHTDEGPRTILLPATRGGTLFDRIDRVSSKAAARGVRQEGYAVQYPIVTSRVGKNTRRGR